MRLPILSLLAIASFASAAETNLIVNGDFEKDSVGWQLSDKAKIVIEGTNKFLRIDGSTVVGYNQKTIEIDPTWKSLKVSVKIRATGFKQGTEAWQVARIANSFVMADGSSLYPNMAQLGADSAEWQTLVVEQPIPAGAKTYTVQAANFGSAGQIDFDDVVISAN